MKRIMLSLVSILTAAILFGAEPVKSSTDLKPSPDTVLRSFVEFGRVPGVVALAATKDKVIHQGAFGSRDLETRAPMEVDTLIAIASMTKPLTSVAVMQLVEWGQIELEASVARYLPELAQPKVVDGFDDTVLPRLRPAKRPPTIREWLSNTSGYADFFWNEDLLGYEDAKAKISEEEKGFFSPLVSDPGTRWDYSPGTMVLGIVVEKASALNLEEYFRQHIFAPLGMDDTSYQVPANKWSRVARLHQRKLHGSVVVYGPKVSDSPPRVTEFRGDLSR